VAQAFLLFNRRGIKMRKLLFLLLLAPSFAHASIYDVQCTAPCIASDHTTQPNGTILNLIQWCGSQAQCPYTPMDGAGNTNDVTLVADPQGTGQVYQPPQAVQPVPAQSESDCTVTSGGSCTLPAGTGLSQWTGSGTLTGYTLNLPSNPIIGPQSLLQINLLGTFTVSSVVIKFGATTIATVNLSAPKVYRLEYTNTGWAVLPN